MKILIFVDLFPVPFFSCLCSALLACSSHPCTRFRDTLPRAPYPVIHLSIHPHPMSHLARRPTPVPSTSPPAGLEVVRASSVPLQLLMARACHIRCHFNLTCLPLSLCFHTSTVLSSPSSVLHRPRHRPNVMKSVMPDLCYRGIWNRSFFRSMRSVLTGRLDCLFLAFGFYDRV